MLNTMVAQCLRLYDSNEGCLWFSEGLCKLAELEGAVLASKNVIHFLFPFRFEEDIEEDRNHCQEEGHPHHSHHQPSKGGICEERQRYMQAFMVIDFLKTLSARFCFSIMH